MKEASMQSITMLGLCILTAAGTMTARAAHDPALPTPGLATLYQRDPLANKLSFGTGAYGSVFQDHQVKNHQSDIDFGQYHANEFTVGIEGGSIGAIVDLGSPESLQQEYGYEETVGGGQGFASIRMENGRLVILADRRKQTTQPLRNTSTLFAELKPSAHAPIHDNHVYVVRLRDTHEPQSERLTKLLVVRYEPGVSVTLRWQAVETNSAR
jgi:hypothetical protein